MKYLTNHKLTISPFNEYSGSTRSMSDIHILILKYRGERAGVGVHLLWENSSAWLGEGDIH